MLLVSCVFGLVSFLQLSSPIQGANAAQISLFPDKFQASRHLLDDKIHTRKPTHLPTTRKPTLAPTLKPTRHPTPHPTHKPTKVPTLPPSKKPSTARPTHAPSTRKPTSPSSGVKGPCGIKSCDALLACTQIVCFSPTVYVVSFTCKGSESFSWICCASANCQITCNGGSENDRVCSEFTSATFTTLPGATSIIVNVHDGQIVGNLPSRAAACNAGTGGNCGGGNTCVLNLTLPTTCLTHSPTHLPTRSPTHLPTRSPTRHPTNSPTTRHPTNSPTTRHPTNSPTHLPTHSPTHLPTRSPTHLPTRSPTHLPTNSPTRSPTRLPTRSPTGAPTTNTPTQSPTACPPCQARDSGPDSPCNLMCTCPEQCNVTTGVCAFPASVCTPCNATNPCPTNNTCDNGVCVPAGICDASKNAVCDAVLAGTVVNGNKGKCCPSTSKCVTALNAINVFAVCSTSCGSSCFDNSTTATGNVIGTSGVPKVYCQFGVSNPNFNLPQCSTLAQLHNASKSYGCGDPPPNSLCCGNVSDPCPIISTCNPGNCTS